VRAGGPARIMKGEIRDRTEVVYVFKGRADQKFSGSITRHTGDASFAVTDPDGEALPEEEFDVNTRLKGSLTKNGDYKITVNTVNSRNSKYSLSVRLFYGRETKHAASLPGRSCLPHAEGTTGC
jgi:hypothetical protein